MASIVPAALFSTLGSREQQRISAVNFRGIVLLYLGELLPCTSPRGESK